MLSKASTLKMQAASKASNFSSDKFQDECGVFGIFGSADAAAHTALGLHAVQHRGQEAAGIVTHDNSEFYYHRALGLVGDNFNSEKIIDSLKGAAAIGHNRYSTSGEPSLRNVQPLFAELEFGGIALAHNGNLTNAQKLKRELIAKGSIFQTTSDTETLVHLVSTSKEKLPQDRLIDALKKIKGAYSLVVLTRENLIGVRDPKGVRPLVLGELDGAYVLASETVSFDIIGANYIRDIEPGEMVIISESGIKSLKPFEEQSKKFCIFEYVYFSRPDSLSEGKNVYGVRKEIGAQLAREDMAAGNIDADIIVAVPDSGVPAAVGYAQAAQLPLEIGIVRNHYVGRTFIEPTDSVRHLGVKLKHNANRDVIAGKRVVLVDDSIVRGTTSKKIVQMVKDAGAKSVHMRVASPPTTNPCFYGVDTPEKEKLMAAKYKIEKMRELIEADSLSFLSVDGLYRAVGEASRNNDNPQFCDACFTGEYPIEITDFNEGLT